MQQPTDLSTITDIKELKAMAFDQIGILEQTQNNLRNIQGRIQQLSQTAAESRPKVEVEA
jgi:uncharacterized coiled-coil protein SlyX